MGRDNTNPQSRRNKRKMAKANDAKRRTQEADAAPVREHGQDCVDTVGVTEGAGEVRSGPSSALQDEAQDLRAVEQTTRENSAVKSGGEGESAPRRESTLEGIGEAQEVKKPGWRHIGRVPGSTLTESDPSSARPLQLPTEVCERIIDWQWDSTWMLRRCALVCKARTPRCRYWMQRNVVLWERSHVQGHARRARAQPHLLQQARSVWLPLVWRLDILRAIWKPSDFHPLLLVHLSAFSSLTTLRLYYVTFPKVREFGRLVCALPGLVHLTCENVLFTNTAPCPSLAITRCPPSVRLTGLVILSSDETSSHVEANKALVGHLKDMCPQLDELFSNKDYEKLHHVDFVFWAYPDLAIPDATRWSTLLKAEMPELHERGVLRTRVDVYLGLVNEDYL
ncbi:hypothetical protein WOLCODRAFT_148511 [Wolfiporia cocos MD-104 SS10]|uniref:F-box domain-containing protein n=1 Tax=Wolfiporia cocos (strain MD-104) TaxID=742152 RepID=A0A2H3IYE9_WOLCO|nr:hypothetical protein WOLCODRAFT_148511 [Wolfiporia cocos MD-104 SS10]